jgi:lysophospholipase L1-like esterase
MAIPRIIMFLAGWTFLIACEASEDHIPDMSDNEKSETRQSAAKKYLALGDSYTIGEAVQVNERYPAQLQQKLVGLGINLESPDIIARTGWTTDELMEAIRQASPASNYHLVTLLIGVNNQYRGRDTAEYRKQFRELLDMAVGFAGRETSKVIVVSIPDYAITPFGQSFDPAKISREINWYNKINQQETLRKEVKYVNITPISREGLAHPELVARDGLHPSGEMYRRWVELLLPVAKKILTGN